MRQLQILEHASGGVLVLFIIGTLLSLFLVYVLFTKGWALALGSFIMLDLLLLSTHKYLSNREPKIREINHEGIVTNDVLIKYTDIKDIRHEFKHVKEDDVIHRLDCLVVLTSQASHTFKASQYKNSCQEIVSCIKHNMQHSRSK